VRHGSKRSLDWDRERLKKQKAAGLFLPLIPWQILKGRQPMTVIESLKLKSENDCAKAASEWEAIVAKVADDAATESEVGRVLKLTGRSLDQLQTAVSRAQEVKRLRVMLDNYGEAAAAEQLAMQSKSQFRTRKRDLLKQLNAEELKLDSAIRHASFRKAQIHNAACDLQRLTGETINLQVPEAEPVMAPFL